MPNARATQDDRILKLTTPLGKDFLLVDSFAGREGISSLFKFQIGLLHQEESEQAPPHEVKPTDILGKAVMVELVQRNGTTRHFHGIVNRFTQGGRDPEFTTYQMEVVPQLWLLTQTRQSRIFQNKNVKQVLETVLEGLKFKIQTQRTYHPRTYCVQYRESDFNFASRMMEEEGIFYYFDHTVDSHTMIIADTPESHRDCKSKSSIDFVNEITGEFDTSVVYEWGLEYQLQTGKFELWDHQFQLPYKKLEAPKPSRFNDVGNQALEFYDYPGGYAKKFDGVDKGGGEQSHNLQNVFEDNMQVVQSAVDALDAKFKTFKGKSDCGSFTAGDRFTIDKLPINGQNGQYALTSVRHHCDQSPSYRTAEDLDKPYLNEFECIPVGDSKFPPFRPQQSAAKPVIQGSQTGYVVGPPGEEIHTDKYGRVKVQLHWDRQGQNDAGSSCWMRVAQSWAGKQWGTMFIPRIGTEVVVQFLDGDPDRPIVVGCVYNPEAMPPYTLPDEKTKSTIKSNSSKGGSGFNELRLEDKAGSEQIFIHAQKNQDIRVKNDNMEWIGQDRHLIVKRDQFEKVEKNKHLLVKSDQTEKVDGNVHLKVGSSKEQKIGSKFAVDAGTEVHVKAGTSAVIEAGTSLTLKVGGNFININSGGIFIQGTMVMLNSGGGAGAGSGASPGTPKDPKEADKADSGKALPAAPTRPPKQPEALAPLLAAARNPAGPPVDQVILDEIKDAPAQYPVDPEPPVDPQDGKKEVTYEQIQDEVRTLVSKMQSKGFKMDYDDFVSGVCQAIGSTRTFSGRFLSLARWRLDDRIGKMMYGLGLNEEYEQIKKRDQEIKEWEESKAAEAAERASEEAKAAAPALNYALLHDVDPDAVSSIRAAQGASLSYQMYDSSLDAAVPVPPAPAPRSGAVNYKQYEESEEKDASSAPANRSGAVNYRQYEESEEKDASSAPAPRSGAVNYKQYEESEEKDASSAPAPQPGGVNYKQYEESDQPDTSSEQDEEKGGTGYKEYDPSL